MRIATYVMAFNQGRWILRNIENAYDHVDRIYVLYSQFAFGKYGSTDESDINNFDISIIENSKYRDKITILKGEWNSDTDARNFCLKLARFNQFDYLMAQDADEFYFHEDFEKIIKTVKDNPDVDVFEMQNYTFWKSFEYILMNPEKGRSEAVAQCIVNLRTIDKYDYIRDVRSGKHMLIPEVFIYHGAYIRSNEEMYVKIKTWGHAKDFDVDKWYNNVWLNWTLESKNLHPIWPEVWSHCEIFEGTLPEVIQDLRVNSEQKKISRSDIINLIFEKYGFKSYLEIGVWNGENFNKINAEIKDSVDPYPETTECSYKVTSDEFFDKYANSNYYDVIFIDGLHTAEQVYQDVANSLKHINNGGFIILHDCNPEKKENASAINNGGIWNGTVYQAFIQLKYELKDWSCFVIDEDYGCGIITRREILKNERIPFNSQNYLWENFNKNRKELLQLISFENFKSILVLNELSILPPVGMGDLLISYGIIKEYSDRYDKINCYVSEYHYSNAVRLYKSIPNVNVVVFNVINNLVQVQPDTMILGWHNYENALKNNPNLHGDEFIYDYAKVDHDKMWDNFYIERDIEAEKNVFYNILGIKDNEEYIFLHEDSHRSLFVNREYIDSTLKVINPNDYPHVSLFDFLYTIENAKEVHVINSSFRALIELTKIKHENLFFHRYIKDQPERVLEHSQLEHRLKWNIIISENYYGQEGEDKFIQDFFGDSFIGGCIDVGASNGVDISNTKHFEENGWYCLCIEPNPDSFKNLSANRLNAINYAVADTNESGLEFSIFKVNDGSEEAISALKTDERLLKMFEGWGHKIEKRIVTVEVRTLDYCIENFYKHDTIDFVSIDTEGTELDVLRGFSIEKWNPKLLVIEDNFSDVVIEEYLKPFGYTKIKRIGANDFYAKQERNA